MKTFSVNQATQVYVAKDVKAYNASLTTLGDLKLSTDSAAPFFKVVHNGNGGIVASDLIECKNVEYIKATDASKLETKTQSYKIALNASVNSGAPIAGQDYIVRTNITQAFGMGDEETYIKDACVHATTGMTASQFYLALLNSFVKNFSRDLNNWFTFKAHNSTDSTLDLPSAVDDSDTYDYIVVIANEPEWVLGMTGTDPLYFTVSASTVTSGSDEVQGITVTDDTANTGVAVVNSKRIADYEWFHMGARSDIYRQMGFPNYIPTKYLVDPTNAYGYTVVDIHYSYVGPNEGPQKSEKDLVILLPKASASDYTDTNLLIKNLATVTGKTVYGGTGTAASQMGASNKVIEIR